MMTRMSLIAVLERDERITLDESHPVWDAALRLIVDAQRETLDGILDEPAKPPSVIAKRKPEPAVHYEPAPLDVDVSEYIGNNPGMAADTIASFFGCATAGISAAVKRLEKAGLIRTAGTHRGKRYYPPKPASSDSDGHDHAAAALGAQAEDASLTIGGEP